MIGEKKIQAHKTILAAHSPVFSAMFDHSETKEAQEGEVKITDIEADVFEELLCYLYAGKMPDLSKFALELFVASDKVYEFVYFIILNINSYLFISVST
mgnify:CR=1 FL=1